MSTLRIETNVTNETLSKVKEAQELLDKLSKVISDLRFSGLTLELKEEKTSSEETDEGK